MNNKYIKDTIKLYDFQKEAVKYLAQRKKSVLGLPTGLGKTITIYYTFAYLKKRNPDLKLIFVSEKSIIAQATEDLEKFFNLTYTKIYEDTPTTRKKKYKDWAENKDILFMNYAPVRNDFELLKQAILKAGKENVVVVFDEAQALKNRTSKIHTIAKQISKNVGRVYALTATPSKGKLEDLFNILIAIDLKVMTIREFENIHCVYQITYRAQIRDQRKVLSNLVGFPRGKVVEYKGSIKHTPIAILSTPNDFKISIMNPQKGSISVQVSNTRKKYWFKLKYTDKQPKEAVVMFFPFEDKQLEGYKNIKYFKELVKDFLFYKSKKEVAPQLPAFIIVKRIFEHDKKSFETIRDLYRKDEAHNAKISIALSTPQVINKDIPSDYVPKKIAELLDLLENGINGEKVIIYSPYKTVIETTKRIIEKKLQKETVAIVGGSDSKTAREKFNNDVDILLMTNAGAAGLNLQAAANIVFLNMPYTAGDYFQIAGRISRVGTKHTKLTLHFLITDNSNDLDWYQCIMGQANFLHKLNPDLVDEGVIDKQVTLELDEKDSDMYIKQTLKNRKEQYLN